MDLRQIANSIATGDSRCLRDGTLFRSIRGLQSKLFLVNVPNALEALSMFISHEETSNAALRAVAQAAANTDGLSAAKQSELICWEIAQVPGLLMAVVARMENDVDAVRLVNNLAANSVQSALLFSNVPGSVQALKGATRRFKLHAFGVINHLSRFKPIAEAMVNAGFVDEILIPAVSGADPGGASSELSLEEEATIARATLALANLSANCGCHCPSVGRRALRTVVKVFDHAVRGETLATITWLPTTVLFGVCNAALNHDNALPLLEGGIAAPLARLLLSWDPAAGPDTLELGVRAAGRLAVVEGSFGHLWAAGILPAVLKVAAGECGDEATAAAAAAAVAALQARHVAVCMGHDRRLGQASPLMLLDDAVVHMVLSLAYPPPSAAPAQVALPALAASPDSRLGWLMGDAAVL